MTTSESDAVAGSPALRDDVFHELRRGFDGLTQSQKRIAEAIVADPEFVAFATVDKFGARLGLSPSTIVRFTYKIGLNGYQDLQNRVRDIVRSQFRSAQAGDNVPPTSHLKDTHHAASLDRDLTNLHRTVQELNGVTIDRAVDMILAAATVYVVGGLSSDSLADYTSLALDRTRGGTVRLQASGRSSIRLADMTKRDALLAFSFPPYSSATLGVVDFAKQNRVDTIGVTDSPISPIGQRVDVVLTAHVAGVGLHNSMVAPMAVINVLLNAVALRLPGAVDRYRRVLRLMNEWNSFVLKDDDEDEARL